MRDGASGRRDRFENNGGCGIRKKERKKENVNLFESRPAIRYNFSYLGSALALPPQRNPHRRRARKETHANTIKQPTIRAV